jgi:hypothetical protein
MLKALMLAVVGTIVTVTVLYLFRSRPVLFRSSERGDPSGEPSFVVFNPFRDQAPERCADSFLESIKGGRCEEAASALPIDLNYRQYICEMEKGNPLARWLLKNRTDHRDTVKMFYWPWADSSEFHGKLWVTVEKRDGQWHVTGYERHY